MSGNIKPDPYVPNLYNLNDFYHSMAPLTLEQGDDRYLQLTGGTLTGILFCSNSLSVTGSILLNGTIITASATEINFLTGITPGLASASRALVLDASRNITNINSITTSTINCTSSATAINISGVSGDIVLSGTATSIQCTGAASGIVITGTSSFLTIGPSASLILNSITLTSTGTELNYLHGSTPGSGTASNALVLDASRNINNINSLSTATMSISSSFNITATTDSTSTSTGSFTTLGGVGVAKSLYVGTGIVIPNASGGDMITLTSTSSAARNTIKFITDTQTWECGTRGSTASNPNTFYIYNGGYKLLMNTTGDTSILSTTDSSSASTGCLKLSGGLGVVKNMYCTGTLTLDRNGSNLAFTNGSNSGLIELAASPNMLRVVNGYAVNIGSAGVTIASGSSAAARYAIDLQATANDIQLCLFQSGSNAAYAIGANNSALEFHSGSAFAWYGGTTGNGALGTKLLNLTSGGSLTSTQNLISLAGVHSNSLNTTGLAALGNSAHMHFGASTGSFFTYDYGTGQYGNTMIGNNSIASCSNGYVNINTSSFTQNAPLAVFGSTGFTRATGFGYLASSGSGTATGFTNRPFSIYSEWGIIVGSGEIDVFSDLRLKKNVLPLNDELCSRFIKHINPIQFKYNHDDDREHYGYSAQQLMSYGYTTLVGMTHADQPLPEEKIPTYILDTDGKLGDMKLSGETIDLPGDVRLCVSMIDMIPILHKCIQAQQKAMDDMMNQITELKEKCELMVGARNLNVPTTPPTNDTLDTPTPLRRTRIFTKKKIVLIQR